MNHYYDMLPGENWFDYQAVYDLILDVVPKGGRFVEVGSWKGRSISYFVVEMINRGLDIGVDCVDLWGGNPLNGGVDIGGGACGDAGVYDQFLRNVAPILYKIRVVREDSVKAAGGYGDGSLDAVMLDANHGKEETRANISAWWPKVKVGGILAGHDIDWSWVFEAVGEELYRKNRPGVCKLMGRCWLWFKGGE
jgi:hypothetical protein